MLTDGQTVGDSIRWEVDGREEGGIQMRGTSVNKQPALRSVEGFIVVVGGRGDSIGALLREDFYMEAASGGGRPGRPATATSPLRRPWPALRSADDSKPTQRKPPTQHHPFGPLLASPQIISLPASTSQARHAILASQCVFRAHNAQESQLPSPVRQTSRSFCAALRWSFFCLPSVYV